MQRVKEQSYFSGQASLGCWRGRRCETGGFRGRHSAVVNPPKLRFRPLCCKTTSSPTFLHFKKAIHRPAHLSKPASFAFCSLFALLHLVRMHMCISLELFTLCFVFNTPSCKSKAARHTAVRTPLPLQPVPPWLENLWPSHRP